MLPVYLRSVLRRGAPQLARRNPRWSPQDATEQASAFRAVDRAMLKPILMTPGAMRPPSSMAVPSLVVLAERSHVLDDAQISALEHLGFVVRRVIGAGHNVHLDDYDGFLATVDDWI
jgi:pimeloyl-ACP methyl ester carboxylesterase